MAKKVIDVNMQPNEDQLVMLKKASEMPIVYDEDSPELDDEELKQFKRISETRKEERRKQTVTIRIL